MAVPSTSRSADPLEGRLQALRVSQSIYEPLVSNQIRVLDIEPAQNYDGELRCHFWIIHLDNPALYQTLSYAWGELRDDGSHLSQNCIVDNQRLRITENLDQALRRIRHHQHMQDHDLGHPLPIWADAICINQNDQDERNRQVTMMSRIYAKDVRLFVWLGDDDLDDASATKLSDSLDMLINSSKICRVPTSNSERARTVNFMKRLTTRAWFKRRWVCQEVAMSKLKTCDILLGPSCHPIWHLMDALMEIGIISSRAPWLYDAAPILCYLENNRMDDFDSMTIISRRSLLQNLWDFEALQCGDLRDRIYALHSFSDRRIAVDYGLSPAELYIRVAKAYVNLQEVVRLLAFASASRPSTLGGVNLPSWVPDFGNSRAYSSKQHQRAVEWVWASDVDTTLSGSHSTIVDVNDEMLLCARLKDLCVHHSTDTPFTSASTSTSKPGCSECELRGASGIGSIVPVAYPSQRASAASSHPTCHYKVMHLNTWSHWGFKPETINFIFIVQQDTLARTPALPECKIVAFLRLNDFEPTLRGVDDNTTSKERSAAILDFRTKLGSMPEEWLHIV